MMLCAIWYHYYNLKNVRNTHGGLLHLVKLQPLACNFTKSDNPPWVLSRFLNGKNDTRSRNASDIWFSDLGVEVGGYRYGTLTQNGFKF